jgi:hypothetical protein
MDPLLEYRAAAKAKHAAHVLAESQTPLAQPSSPQALAASASESMIATAVDPASGAPFRMQTLRDQVVCGCAQIRHRCAVCAGRVLAGAVLPLGMPAGGGDSSTSESAGSTPDTDRRLAQVAGVFHRAFKPITLAESHALSSADKAVLAAKGFSNTRALIYGEVEFYAFARVLEVALGVWIEANPGGCSAHIFMDLGSGVGRAAVAAAVRDTYVGGRHVCMCG